MKTFNWKRSLVSLSIGTAMYLVLAALATQGNPTQDWGAWALGAAGGAGYAQGPRFIKFLARLQDKYGDPEGG